MSKEKQICELGRQTRENCAIEAYKDCNIENNTDNNNLFDKSFIAETSNSFIMNDHNYGKSVNIFHQFCNSLLFIFVFRISK